MAKRYDQWSRRRFVATAASAAGLTAVPEWRVFADGQWNAGIVAHLLPTANHERFAIKASFTESLADPPGLRVGGRHTIGRPTASASRVF